MPPYLVIPPVPKIPPYTLVLLPVLKVSLDITASSSFKDTSLSINSHPVPKIPPYVLLSVLKMPLYKLVITYPTKGNEA
jgi:hypothetical protein